MKFFSYGRSLAVFILFITLASLALANLYDVLNVPPSASQSDIRNAFRNLATNMHPDKNPDNEEWAAEKFIELAGAYEILGNEKNRKHYDETGGTEETNQPPVQRGGAQYTHVHIPMSYILQETILDMTLTSKCLCSACQGTRINLQNTNQLGAAPINGENGIVATNLGGSSCPRCNGSGMEDCATRFHLRVQKGLQDGSHFIPQMPPETISKHIIFVYTQHDFYKRLGDNIKCNIIISESEAQGIVVKTIPLIEGGNHTFSQPPPIKNKQIHVIPLLGLPSNTFPHKRGHIIVMYVVEPDVETAKLGSPKGESQQVEEEIEEEDLDGLEIISSTCYSYPLIEFSNVMSALYPSFPRINYSFSTCKIK